MKKLIDAEVCKEMIEAAKRIKIPMSVCASTDHYWEVFLTEVLESAPAASPWVRITPETMPKEGSICALKFHAQLIKNLHVLIDGEFRNYVSPIAAYDATEYMLIEAPEGE